MQRLNSLLHVRPALRLTNLSQHPKFYPKMSVNAPSAAETDAQAEKVANTSGITTESLQKTITEKLEAKHVDIEDMSGKSNVPLISTKLTVCDADHYQAAVAKCFKP